MCCGVGISTRALRIAFPEAETVVGVDTSSEMISMAQFLSQHSSVVMRLAQSFTRQYKTMTCPRATSFTEGNAEKTLFPGRSFDLVTIMYAFHEAPKEGRDRILREAHRLLEPGGTLAVIDICTDYTPSKAMLVGEPYGKTFEWFRQNIVLNLLQRLMPCVSFVLYNSVGISKRHSPAASYLAWFWQGFLQDISERSRWNVGSEAQHSLSHKLGIPSDTRLAYRVPSL